MIRWVLDYIMNCTQDENYLAKMNEAFLDAHTVQLRMRQTLIRLGLK